MNSGKPEQGNETLTLGQVVKRLEQGGHKDAVFLVERWSNQFGPHTRVSRRIVEVGRTQPLDKKELNRLAMSGHSRKGTTHASTRKSDSGRPKSGRLPGGGPRRRAQERRTRKLMVRVDWKRIEG